MDDGKTRILNVLGSFTGRDGEPGEESEHYTLKAMWLMMLSEFEASVKLKVENYIDRIKANDINHIHICLLIRNFFGDKQEELTANKILSFYKKSPEDINYRNFTRDRVPKYKTQAVEKLFNSLGLFFNEEELTTLSILDSIASTRDSIAHGDLGIEITRRELESRLVELNTVMEMLINKLS